MCRWLLLSLDHLGSNDLQPTLGHIANMLDRESLEGRTCECYLAIKNEYGRLLVSLPAI